MRGPTGLNKALHVGIVGVVVALTTWDVNRHVALNRVPVSRQQGESIHIWKEARKHELEEASQSRSIRFMQTLASRGGAGGDTTGNENVRGETRMGKTGGGRAGQGRGRREPLAIEKIKSSRVSFSKGRRFERKESVVFLLPLLS